MIIRPEIFSRFPELLAAQSTRLGGVSPMPYGMNLSSHVGDEQANVDENRRRYFEAIGVPEQARAVYQNQVHSATIHVASGEEGIVRECDGLITERPNVLLGVTIADCTPVLIYDPKHRVIAAIHAGWRGTEQMITLSTVRKMVSLGSEPGDLYAFIGASASQERYEVGLEVATLFEYDHLIEKEGQKFLLDVKGVNRQQLTYAGIPETQIEQSPLCSIGDDRLHSYRRDGKQSGRMLAVIMMRG